MLLHFRRRLPKIKLQYVLNKREKVKYSKTRNNNKNNCNRNRHQDFLKEEKRAKIRRIFSVILGSG